MKALFFENLDLWYKGKLQGQFACLASQKKESGYPVISDFAVCIMHLGLTLMVMPPYRSILGTEQTFLLPWAGQILIL